jgi:hypothetical protein
MKTTDPELSNVIDAIEASMENMESDQLRAVMLKAIEHLAQLFPSAEADIHAAQLAAGEAAMESESGTESPVTISFQIKLDAAKKVQTGKIAVSIRKAHETSAPMRDPNQPELL